MNRVNLIGRITNKPELRYTSSSIPVTSFRIAVNQGYGDNKKTDFIPIIVWKKQAENVCNYLDKGSLIAVDGRIQTGSYEDKNGKKSYTFDVVADMIHFLESKKDEQAVNLRIRKLTPRECFRLMGVKDEDYEREEVDPFSQFGEQISLDDADLD